MVPPPGDHTHAINARGASTPFESVGRDAIVQAIDGDGRVSGPACAGFASLYLLLVPLPQVALAVLIWRRS